MKHLIYIVLSIFLLESCATTQFKEQTFPTNSVIYEVNVRQYSKEGTLQAVTNDLPRIKKLGVDVVWLMPIHPIGKLNRKGTLGSYYAVQDYQAINPEFGTLEDFKHLVDKAHKLKMKVIIDWVANHSSPDNVWIKNHLDYYTKDENGNAPIPTLGTDWTDVADLNYDNYDMRKAMLDAMKFWVTETNIDGFRCDVAESVPMDFWHKARTELNNIKTVFLLAEGSKKELFSAFDAIYGWEYKELMLDIAKGKKSFADWIHYRKTYYNDVASGKNVMYFTTNHDENSWNYLEKDVFGKNTKNYAILTTCLGGIPLVYNGQESGLDKKILFFEKDAIEWKNYENAAFYQKLFSIYTQNDALYNGISRGNVTWSDTNTKHIFAFEISGVSNNLLIIQNHSDTAILYKMNSELLDKYDLTDLLSDKKITILNGELSVPKNYALVFKNK